MTAAEIVPWVVAAMAVAGFAMNVILNARSNATAHATQFSTLEKACSDGISAVRNEFSAKLEINKNDAINRIDVQGSNLGNVMANLKDRMHELELKTMESRALAAETYMRRDNYLKATEDFKREVKDAHSDLKAEMYKGFEQIHDQISSVSMSIESARKANNGFPSAKT